jgi:hypothetical protein
MTAYLERMLSEYGAEQSFVAAMNLHPVSREHQQKTMAFALQNHLQLVQSQSGTAAAIELVKEKLKIAADRRARGTFIRSTGIVTEILGWETGIEPATSGATVRCSAS